MALKTINEDRFAKVKDFPDNFRYETERLSWQWWHWLADWLVAQGVTIEDATRPSMRIATSSNTNMASDYSENLFFTSPGLAETMQKLRHPPNLDAKAALEPENRTRTILPLQFWTSQDVLEPANA